MLRDEQPPPPLILIPVKFVGGVLAMGAGLAFGRDGPTAQMGAGIGDLLGTAFRRNQDDVKALLAAGAGAGLATGFSAPVAGALLSPLATRLLHLSGLFVLGLLDRKTDAKKTIWNPKKMLSSTSPKTA